MKQTIRLIAVILVLALTVSLCACSKTESSESSGKAYIEKTLNLANNKDQEWTYSADADAWVLSAVSAVAYPELPDQQGVSVCVPGAYVTGIDTDRDGKADVTSENASEAVKGSLVIDYDAQITSTNGQIYTAAAYRTKGASKAMPGFDVIDYGQEDYVFGSSEKDARHWDTYLLEIFEEHADVLESLFNR